MADWYNNDWDYRFKVTSDNTKVLASIKGLAIDLSNAPAGFWSNVQGDGADIRVTQSDGTTLVARDVISIDTTGQTGLLRVDTSGISTSADTDYYVYYGNTSATQPAATDTFGQYNAYDEDIIIYYAMEEGSGTTTNNRATNSNHGSLSSASWSSDSIIGAKSISFSDSLINTGMTNIAANGSVKVLYKTSSSTRMGLVGDETHDIRLALNYQPGIASSQPGYLGLTPSYDSGLRGYNDNGSTIYNDEWHMFSGNWVGSSQNLDIIFDAEDLPVTYHAQSTFSGASANNLYLGKDLNNGNPFSGLMGEFVYLTESKPISWHSTYDNNVLDNASFWTFGAQEEVVGAGVNRPLFFGGGL